MIHRKFFQVLACNERKDANLVDKYPQIKMHIWGVGTILDMFHTVSKMELPPVCHAALCSLYCSLSRLFVTDISNRWRNDSALPGLDICSRHKCNYQPVLYRGWKFVPQSWLPHYLCSVKCWNNTENSIACPCVMSWNLSGAPLIHLSSSDSYKILTFLLTVFVLTRQLSGN